MANKIIDSLTYGSDNYTFTIPYGTCDTDADDPDKVVVCPNFVTLETGARIAVWFENDNDSGMDGGGVTLKVNNTDAKPMNYPLEQDSIPLWAPNSVVEFIYTGKYWQPILDSNLLSAITHGEVTAMSANYADYASRLLNSRTFSLTGRVQGSASFNGSSNCNITTTTPYLDKLIAQANCIAAGAKLTNAIGHRPPVLASARGESNWIKVYGERFLKSAPGITFQTEWYSTTSSAGSAEYYVTNTSPYYVTIAFYLTADFYSRGAAQWETVKSKLFWVTLAPGQTASGSDTKIESSYPDAELDDSGAPGIALEALGYDPT